MGKKMCPQTATKKRIPYILWLKAAAWEPTQPHLCGGDAGAGVPSESCAHLTLALGGKPRISQATRKVQGLLTTSDWTLMG